MDKIDWNKPVQIRSGGVWYDVDNEGNTLVAPNVVRNKPEPRYVWLNVYNSLDTSINHSEEYAKLARSKNRPYLHTLKVNVDTGETEKIAL